MRDTSPHVGHERDATIESWEGIVSWRTLISADRTPTDSLTMGSAEVAVGASEVGALHRHAAPEIYYVISGEGEVHIDGVDHAVSAGSAVFVPGDAWHFMRNTGTDTLKLLYVFAADSFADVEYIFPETAAQGSTALAHLDPVAMPVSRFDADGN